MRQILLLLSISWFPSCAYAALFNIEFNFDSSVTVEQQGYFLAAEATWESLVVGYLDSPFSNPVPMGALVIDASVIPIDGSGGILGQAGPTTGFALTGGSYLYASEGIMQFDSADAANQISNGTFGDLILHEMAHVIGFGTLWSSSAAGLPGYQELSVSGSGQYTGAEGLAAYQNEFVGQSAATFVPVELGGGPGTANGHWDEIDGGGSPTGITRVSDGADMRDMLMTGWLNSNSYISDTTLGSFRDLGYITASDASVPEPSSILVLSLLGGIGLFGKRFFRQRSFSV